MQDEKEIPIDIHTNKLLDWLISRRHCNRDWNDNILVVRRKINDAIQDMPASEAITNILSGTYINYYNCLQIVEILKDTESDTKNFFGRYSSQRMKDWVEIVSLYKKKNIYLGKAEAAQMLTRNVNYEIPALKRRLIKLQMMQQDCQQKSLDCVRNGNDLKEKYNSMCRQFGIKGKDVKSELVEVAFKDLPHALEELVRLIRNLSDVVSYYDAFAHYTQAKVNDDTIKSFPMLSHIVEKGNTTTYEWRFGKKPSAIEEVKLESTSTEADKETSDAIDFGDTIDFGGDQIDFGDESTTIDFGNEEPFEIIDAISNEFADVAKGDDALSVFENFKARSILCNELLELEAFLEQRSYEMNLEDDLSALNQFQGTNPIIQCQSFETVNKMSASVRSVIDALNNSKTQQGFLLKSSPRYVDRLEASFKEKLSMSEKMLQQRQIHEKKRDELCNEEVEMQPKIDVIVTKTKELQQQIEDDISMKYKNRPVNLMGGINAI